MLYTSYRRRMRLLVPQHGKKVWTALWLYLTKSWNVKYVLGAVNGCRIIHRVLHRTPVRIFLQSVGIVQKQNIDSTLVTAKGTRGLVLKLAALLHQHSTSINMQSTNDCRLASCVDRLNDVWVFLPLESRYAAVLTKICGRFQRKTSDGRAVWVFSGRRKMGHAACSFLKWADWVLFHDAQQLSNWDCASTFIN